MKARCRSFQLGVNHYTAYLPADNTEYFNTDLNLVDWLSQFGEGNEVYMKGSWDVCFLGRRGSEEGERGR